jgi:hypothetical protein
MRQFNEEMKKYLLQREKKTKATGNKQQAAGRQATKKK